MDDAAPPPMGHNRPPPVDPAALDAFEARVRAMAETAGQWLDEGAVADAADASRAGDFLTALRALHREVDEARREAKRPHDEAAKAVQAAFAPLLAPLEAAAERIKALLAEYAEREQAGREAERSEALARARADLAAAEAERERAACAHDVIGEAAAEHAIAVIEERIAALERGDTRVRIASATGGGRTLAQRTRRVARLVNLNRALIHYRDRAEVAALLERLANADLRGPDAPDHIPGFAIAIERIVA
ncbi:hypothetical protein [Rubellimicrobium sp. CFH 75288]|uniref:hypothetical protein n=1 Tax=Rubellimicrobium sp. CFH 75288 TaxID=2697034 RepID=UPI001412B4C1|nr:hypothetical protein [Rubellimicrobium sp. CFH 75288]NAZ37192.1 hypothetical protein [Rubellimicrobium sp. CFH 75288]